MFLVFDRSDRRDPVIPATSAEAARGAAVKLKTKNRVCHREESDPFRFVRGDFRRLPLGNDLFDFAWCAQSLYSLPDPLEALREMRRKAKPGGFVAVIENDEFHDALLPWPIEIERSLCLAELVSHIERSRKPRKFYVGRHLLEPFHAVGLSNCWQRTWTFDRQAPLEANERAFFVHHIRELRELTRPHLSPEILDDFERLACPESNSYLLS